MECPFFILHYKKNLERREYLRRSFEGKSVSPIWIEELDQGEFPFDETYHFDKFAWDRMMLSIKDNIIGTMFGLHDPALHNTPWADCIKAAIQRNFNLDEAYRLFPLLRPVPLRPNDVSVILKNKVVWQLMMKENIDYAIIAEDDLVVGKNSFAYLSHILATLPQDFDFVDIAGGLGLMPRVGNRLVNGFFYEIDPPRPRTCCCTIVRKSFVERVLHLDPPIVVGIDWLFIHIFKLIRAKVYWVEPLVFGHGSQMKMYRSNRL